MNHTKYEKVLKVLESKYGYNYHQSLTMTGKNLVNDTLKALQDVESTESAERCKFPDNRNDSCKIEKQDIFLIFAFSMIFVILVAVYKFLQNG